MADVCQNGLHCMEQSVSDYCRNAALNLWNINEFSFINVDTKANFVIEDNIIKGADIKIKTDGLNIGELILKVFNQNPDHIAQIDAETGRKTTFADMKDSSVRCALWMRKQGIGSGDVVTICTHNQLDAYIPCIASFFVGAIYNPWHHEVTLKTAQHFMSLTRPKVVFSCESAVNVLQEAAKLEKVDTRFIIFGKHSEYESLKDTMRLQTNEEVRTFEMNKIENLDEIAMILFSSGTTGMPKGVAHSYNSLLINVIRFVVLPIKDCITLWYSSLYWISGSFCMLQSIITQSTRILHSNFDPIETCKIIDKFKINWFFITPSMITHWCKANVLKNFELKTMKSILTGGSKLSREVLQEFRSSLPNATFGQGYGMTEIGGIATIQTNECTRVESVGFVVPNVQIKVIDVDSSKVLGPNEPGELCIKCSTMMVGYYKNPTATKATIDTDGWLHTGDKAYFAENGEIFIVDRLKEIMKFRGHHVSPHEIEEVLLGHPAVVEAAVVPVPHDLDIERPMAFVKKARGSELTENELVELSATLGEYKKLWGGVKFVDELPYTPSGKISRKTLKEMAQECVR